MEREQATKFIYDLLRALIAKKGSDLFITAGFPPAMKIDSKMTPVSQQASRAKGGVGGHHCVPHSTTRLVQSGIIDKPFASWKPSNCAQRLPKLFWILDSVI